MVTAGVYMVARSHSSSSIRRSRSRWSRGSAWRPRSSRLDRPRADDIKRVLAYSTVSQLGYMFAAVGVGAYAAGDLYS